MKKSIVAGLFLAALTIGKVSAQDIVSRVAGLEDNKEYMDLLRRDEQLRVQTDSLMFQMRTLRSAMTKNAEQRDSLAQVKGDSLMMLLSGVESKVYALRASKVKLIDKINTIEQNYVLSTMGNIGDAQSAQGSKSLYSNAYFVQSFDGEDYKMLMDVHGKEAKAYGYVQTYVKNYSNIKSLYDQYLLGKEEAEAERLYAEMSEAMAENMIVERQLADIWSEIYDQKCYIYSYFLEKENRLDLLELLENMMAESRQEKLAALDDCVSEYIMDYCLQKPIALNYEMYVAKLLNLPPAIDSLSVAARNVRSIDYRMPVIDVERRSFVDYEPIEFLSRSPYTASNPIPEVTVYEYGDIYRILVGTFKYKQQPSIFRNAAPLYVEQLEDGRFSYYVGGLRTRDEAESAVVIMKKKGFKNPQIVEWCDGEKINLSEEGAARSTYRISISGAALDDVVREVIDKMAEGCQLSRLSENSFLLSSFDSRSVAERVAQAIGKCNDALVVEVQEIKPDVVEEE